MRGYFFLSILSQRLLGTRLALHRDLGQLWGGGAARRPRLYFLSVLLFAVALLFGGYPAQAAQVAQTAQAAQNDRSEEHTSELQSRGHLVCRLLLEKKKQKNSDRRAA